MISCTWPARDIRIPSCAKRACATQQQDSNSWHILSSVISPSVDVPRLDRLDTGATPEQIIGPRGNPERFLLCNVPHHVEAARVGSRWKVITGYCGVSLQARQRNPITHFLVHRNDKDCVRICCKHLQYWSSLRRERLVSELQLGFSYESKKRLL